MERPVFQPVGTPVNDLDTPALVVDLDTMARNIETLHSQFRQSFAKVRPHVSCHQCPNIARLQLAAGGTVNGIAVTTLGEAEVFTNFGFNNILITNPIVTPHKILRLCALTRYNSISVVVDNPQNVEMLSRFAGESQVSLTTLLRVDGGSGGFGISPGEPSLELARVVHRSPNLQFQGLMSFEGPLHYQDKRELAEETRRRIQPVLDTQQMIERDGILVDTVSVGSTANYDVAVQMPGVTEVQAGSYPLMDFNYCQYRTEFTPAAKILTSVISHPVEHRAVVDAGHKATGLDRGVSVLEGVAGATATRFSAEHGILELEQEAVVQLHPNEKVWLVPFDLALCVNQYDYFRAVQDGKLEGFWPIAARGRWD